MTLTIAIIISCIGMLALAVAGGIAMMSEPPRAQDPGYFRDIQRGYSESFQEQCDRAW